MPVRGTMSDLIALERLMIADPVSASSQFSDQQIQDRLDSNRDDIRYEQLTIAPSIVNTASTNNIASTIFSSYYSKYSWWESDVVLQGYLSGAYWKVLTPLASDYTTGLWQFELSEFTTGTVPGQLPPVFATGKVFDVNAAAADLLTFWAAALSSFYDFVSDGQQFRRSQMVTMKLTMANRYRCLAGPTIAKKVRNDIESPISSRRVRLLDDDDSIRAG